MHIDTIQAILLGVAASAGCVFNGWLGSDAANVQWYSSAYRPLMEMIAAVICGILGAVVGTGLSLVACHLWPGSVVASVFAIVLVFPVSFIIWTLLYLPDFLSAMRRMSTLT